MHDAASRKVPEAELPEPAALCPAPVHRYRVEEARHDGAEDDVAVEVAPLSDGARHDGRARRRERALDGQQNELGFPGGQLNRISTDVM